VNRKISAVLVALVLCGAVQSQTRGKRTRATSTRRTAASVEQELRTLQQQWIDAYRKHDADAIARVEAVDFTITYPDASVRTKDAEVEAQRNSRKADLSLTTATEDEHTRVYGDTAVLTGILVSEGAARNPNAVARFRYTSVYVRRGGVWQVVAAQLTAIPDSTHEQATGSEVTTPTGLKYVDLVVGTGASPKPGDRITVHYLGTLEDGKKFDSSYDRGQPFVFQIGVGRVIKGWDEGVMTMKVGGKRKLIIPPELGYGARGAPPVIPPNSTLIFEVELLGIQ
jgi:peptidylprolyl isomerase